MALLKKAAIGWLIIVIGLCCFASYLIPNSRLNSSVLSLLPQTQVNDVPTEVIDGFQNRLDKQLVWLIKPANEHDLSAVQWWYSQLQEQPFISQVNGLIDADFQQRWGQFSYHYRYQLIDENTIERLHSQQQLPWILSQIYSPFSGININELNHDPLLLTRSAQLNQLSQTSHLTVKNNWLTAKDDQGQTWYMIYAELNNSSFNMDSSHQIVTHLNQLAETLQQQWPETEILKRGVLFYSDYASNQAKSDISTIGGLSILGIIILIYAVFRSIRPIVLTIISITIGILCGLIAVLALFGEIHIITLVMSTSIIGIAIDYALHYLTERLRHGNQESAYQSLLKLISTLTIALLTSLFAYLILLFTPFPGLKQLSVFAVFGLIGAFLSVICWYPLLVNKLPVREDVGQRLLSTWLALWQHKIMQLTMIGLACIFIVSGLFRLTINDDIGELQALPDTLKQQEQQIITITDQSSDQKWFVVYGDTAEQTLQRLEHFLPQLQYAQQQGWFGKYQTINLPSRQKQLQNIQQIEQYAPSIIQGLQDLGLNIEPLSFEPSSLKFITPTQWQQSVISQGRKLLWLTLPNGESATLIPISRINNLAELKKLSDRQSGVQWLDRRQEFNDMFTAYRVNLTHLLMIAVSVICLSFMYRNRHYGIKNALKSTLPTLLSVGCAISILGLTHQSLNLFSMLALILVIGIGIDYSLFLSNQHNQASSSLLAVTMAALTTLLSFGLLVLSHTSAIVGFGMVLVGGIFSAFLFAPLAQISQNK
ncbi:MMPL family transporter [Orbus sasakiae]